MNTTPMARGVTPEALAERMIKEGKQITPHLIRYYCRTPNTSRPALYGVAVKTGSAWIIPEETAELFARTWIRSAGNRRKLKAAS